jgi:hypothetical protein
MDPTYFFAYFISSGPDPEDLNPGDSKQYGSGSRRAKTMRNQSIPVPKYWKRVEEDTGDDYVDTKPNWRRALKLLNLKQIRTILQNYV